MILHDPVLSGNSMNSNASLIFKLKVYDIVRLQNLEVALQVKSYHMNLGNLNMKKDVSTGSMHRYKALSFLLPVRQFLHQSYYGKGHVSSS